MKVVTSSEMAWGYTKQTIDVVGKDGKLTSFKNRTYVEGGFAGLERKAAWFG